MSDTLARMDEKFSGMYEAEICGGRPSIAPEKLMRAMLQQVLFSSAASGSWSSRSTTPAPPLVCGTGTG
jgi:hypothetical protein